MKTVTADTAGVTWIAETDVEIAAGTAILKGIPIHLLRTVHGMTVLMKVTATD